MFKLATSLGLTTILATAPAFAAGTVHMQQYSNPSEIVKALSEMGFEIEGQVTDQSDNRLAWRNFALTNGATSLSGDSFSLEKASNGGVIMSLPDELKAEANGEDGEADTLTLLLSDLTLNTSDSGYTLDADQIALDTSAFEFSTTLTGEVNEITDGTLVWQMNDIVAKGQRDGDQMRSTYRIGSQTYQMGGEGTQFSQIDPSEQIAISQTSEGTVGEQTGNFTIGQYDENGFPHLLEGETKIARMEMASSITDNMGGNQSTQSDWGETTTSGSFNNGMLTSSIRISSSTDIVKDSNFALLGIEQAELSAGPTSFELATPISSQAGVGDLKLHTNIENLMIDPQLIALFDPEGVLGNDPMALEIDIEGKARANFDLYEMLQKGEAYGMPEKPYELLEISAPRLALDAFGGKIDISGMVDLQNIDLYAGDSPTEARAEIHATGLMALIQKANQIPGMDPQMAMMAGGMLMGFGIPGENPDEFFSTIEMSKGQLLVNGQPMQP